MPTTYIVEGSGTYWKLRKTVIKSRRGKNFTTTATIGYFKTRAEAVEAKKSNERSYLGPLRNYALGRRMVR